jgi:hypothetical protein
MRPRLVLKTVFTACNIYAVITVGTVLRVTIAIGANYCTIGTLTKQHYQ